MRPKEKISKKSKTDFAKENFLILHNDDVHSFDYVIDALVDICNHGYEQAEQCTMITHYKGKCDVKKGGFDSLKPLKNALIERELIATID
jgi:ATP-dependent Clp protease adaptor protein ClpS